MATEVEILSCSSNLMSAVLLLSEAMLEVQKKKVNPGELLQSLEDDPFGDFAETRENAD